MKITKDGLDYLIMNLCDIYTCKQDEKGTKDYTFETILDFVMNEQKLIILDPETDLTNLNYIAYNMFNHM